jgi:pimeloyl-ACP methyl ester carboxylesterase
MPNPETILLAVGAVALALLGPPALIYLRFRREIRAARERLQSGGGQVINTACGPIEYGTFGEGSPVLVVHGIYGGYDQGLVLARGKLGEEFRCIAPSRFGYLGTPLPVGASPAQQADAYGCLLDALGIEKAAIIGTSAGGTSAIQFALRHPGRCSALVLFSSNAPGETKADLPSEQHAQVLFRSDLIFWLMTTVFPSGLRSTMGVPEKFKLTPEYEADIAEVTKTILPAKPRSAGTLFDMYVSNPDINSGYPLEEITAPVLIISAVDDPLELYRNAQAMAAAIPGAKLVTVDSGGHMLLGHKERVRAEIRAFLEEPRPRSRPDTASPPEAACNTGL